MVIDFSTFYDIPRRMEMMIDNFYPGQLLTKKAGHPPVNILEDKEKILIFLELPGINIEDIDLTLTEGSLVVKGSRSPEEGNYYRQERQFGKFHRIVNVNIPINPDEVKAVMKNGVLQVTLPKMQESKPKKIEIAVE